MEKYRKYIVFQYDFYEHYQHAAGGLADITGSFDTIEEARKYIEAHPYDSSEIVNRDTWEVL